MDNTWQIAKKSLLIEEAKKRSDAARAYSLEIGRRRTKPLPVELEQYLIPPHRPNAYTLLWQRETGVYLTTSGKETLILLNPNHRMLKMRNCLISSLIVVNYHNTVGKMSTKLSSSPLKIVAQYPYWTLEKQTEPLSYTQNRQVHN